VLGSTSGILPATVQYGSHGTNDAYAVKIDGGTLNLIWEAQVGAGSGLFPWSAAFDSSFNFIFTGSTSGIIPGASVSGVHVSNDAFLFKLNGSRQPYP